MTTVFVHLRRVVYLFVFIQCCVCAVHAGSGAAAPEERGVVNCSGGRIPEELNSLAEVSKEYAPFITQAKHPLEEAEKCLLTWRYDVVVCNRSITHIADVVNTTVHILYGVKKSTNRDEKNLREEQGRWVGLLSRVKGVELPDPQPIECGDPRVKEFMDNINKTVGEFNGNVTEVAGLVENARASRYLCGPYRQGLDVELAKWKGVGVDWILNTSKKDENVVCMNETTRESVAKVVTTYDKIVAALDDISNASAGTQVCRVNAGVSWGEDLKKMLGEINGICHETLGERTLPDVKKEAEPEKNLREVMTTVTRTKPDTLKNKPETEYKTRVNAGYIDKFNERKEEAKRWKVEEDRRRVEEEEARKLEEAKRVAEERARKEEEEKKRAAEEMARRASEEKRAAEEMARKAEEAREATEKAKQAAQRAKEEEAKRAAVKAKKKDGCNSPAFLLSPLLFLVLLCVLGSTLVC
ncbi:uncharacterized protein TM35_000851110 [Trypanosoma theileri]|uniref:Uncharacterized protein n=1 Tax=Trypanosoma theileri TaxID=67003 RepID=A0A1X0NFG7_9TRYP|nr:uncharacterized protein TM35_000851110 [Trypanosoma theileri]ORC82666.1 hypothetical protein TM35_000851110 [Trypanosoma theileri]